MELPTGNRESRRIYPEELSGTFSYWTSLPPTSSTVRWSPVSGSVGPLGPCRRLYLGGTLRSVPVVVSSVGPHEPSSLTVPHSPRLPRPSRTHLFVVPNSDLPSGSTLPELTVHSTTGRKSRGEGISRVVSGFGE